MFATHMCVELSAIAAGARAGHSLHCTGCRENEGRVSRWPFARPASRGLARGGGAATARTPRPLPTPAQPALQMVPAGVHLQKPPESVQYHYRYHYNTIYIPIQVPTGYLRK